MVIQDFNANLGRYGFQTTMVDSRVEGKDAIHEILAALQTMAKQDIDVLVIMRGGGSWESLQAFNT
jgi:exonuclease VII large subunit